MAYIQLLIDIGSRRCDSLWRDWQEPTLIELKHIVVVLLSNRWNMGNALRQPFADHNRMSTLNMSRNKNQQDITLYKPPHSMFINFKLCMHKHIFDTWFWAAKM